MEARVNRDQPFMLFNNTWPLLVLKIIMATVGAHSGGDSKAEMELNQEELARREHFALLQNVLVALPLFDQSQRQQLAEQAERILIDNDQLQNPDMQNKLALIRGE